jgi:hypothetical protein
MGYILVDLTEYHTRANNKTLPYLGRFQRTYLYSIVVVHLLVTYINIHKKARLVTRGALFG